MSMKVSAKYQVVIPVSVRKALHIRPGTHVEVIAKGNVACLVPVMDSGKVRRKLEGKLDQKRLRDKKDREL